MPETRDGATEISSPEQLMPIVLEAWRRVLHDPELTASDDFFVAGGDSLLADQVMLEIAELTGIEIPVATLFMNPTATEFVQALTELTRSARSAG
jgi:acyl carrier protein